MFIFNNNPLLLYHYVYTRLYAALPRARKAAALPRDLRLCRARLCRDIVCHTVAGTYVPRLILGYLQSENSECNDWYACPSFLQFDSNATFLQKLYQTSHSSHLQIIYCFTIIISSRFYLPNITIIIIIWRCSLLSKADVLF